MQRKFKLLKDISSPIVSARAGIIGVLAGHPADKVYFDDYHFWYQLNDVERNPDWFEEIKEKIPVVIHEVSDCDSKQTGCSIYVGVTDYPTIKKISDAINKILNDRIDYASSKK